MSPPRQTDPYQLAVRLIGVRAHGEAELRQKLLRRGCDPDDVDSAVGRLREQGYLDDRAFAQGLVAYRSATRGSALIAAELAARGIDRDLAKAALGELDRQRQLEVAARFVERSAGLDPRRLAARLQRRGFTVEVIREVVPGL